MEVGHVDWGREARKGRHDTSSTSHLQRPTTPPTILQGGLPTSTLAALPRARTPRADLTPHCSLSTPMCKKGKAFKAPDHHPTPYSIASCTAPVPSACRQGLNHCSGKSAPVAFNPLSKSLDCGEEDGWKQVMKPYWWRRAGRCTGHQSLRASHQSQVPKNSFSAA